MESKITRALYLRNEMVFHSWLRQCAIDNEDYETAMTQQLMFHSSHDEYIKLRNSLTQKETLHFFEASVCIDYKY